MAETRYMHEALRLAARGRGGVEPNPMVGAVIVCAHGVEGAEHARGGESAILGRGWHRRCGGPHAEVEALRDCRARGHDPAGATMYVTLEPCSHTGRTPPCADTLIEAKLGRVVVAMVDPDPRVAGTGLERLREAGIPVEVGLGDQRARELNEPFIKRVTTGLPWVALKWAQTLDGRLATATGDSQWISGEASRRRVHTWRGRVDAIMVGIGTALADDPQLTARGVKVHRTARRVVVDPALRLPENAKLLERADEAGRVHPPLTLAVRQALLDEAPERVEAWRRRGVEVVGLPMWSNEPPVTEADRGLLDLRPLLGHLAGEHEATNVLVEGGAVLAGALLSQGLADQVLAFVAPKVLGDAGARSAVEGRRCATMAEGLPLSLRRVERIGEDVLLDYRVR